jgi:hypothetical protein
MVPKRKDRKENDRNSIKPKIEPGQNREPDYLKRYLGGRLPPSLPAGSENIEPKGDLKLFIKLIEKKERLPEPTEPKGLSPEAQQALAAVIASMPHTPELDIDPRLFPEKIDPFGLHKEFRFIKREILPIDPRQKESLETPSSQFPDRQSADLPPELRKLLSLPPELEKLFFDLRPSADRRFKPPFGLGPTGGVSFDEPKLSFEKQIPLDSLLSDRSRNGLGLESDFNVTVALGIFDTACKILSSNTDLSPFEKASIALKVVRRKDEFGIDGKTVDSIVAEEVKAHLAKKT